MTEVQTTTEIGRERLIEQLRELVAALDRRVPRLEREGEIRIADEAAALRQKALDRIEQLEK
jgi:hypothetical protein